MLVDIRFNGIGSKSYCAEGRLRSQLLADGLRSSSRDNELGRRPPSSPSPSCSCCSFPPELAAALVSLSLPGVLSAKRVISADTD